MLDELSTWIPKAVTIELTCKCPLDCVHCSSYNSLSSPYDELSKDEICTLVDAVANMKGEFLEISGGEPLGYPYVYDVIQHAKEKGLKVCLFTSGLMPNKQKISPIDKATTEKLSDLGTDKVFVSLHGANSEVHDLITRVCGSFKQLESSIKTLTEHDLYVGAHFVPMKPNFKQLNDVLTYAAEIGMREVGVLRFVPQGRGRLNRNWLNIPPGDFSRFVELLNTARKRDDIITRIGAPLDFSFLAEGVTDPVNCSAGIDKCAVMANGYVVPCPAFKDLPHFIAGNTRESSLENIWMKSKVLAHFRNFDLVKLPSLCRQCSHLEICKGRCPAQQIYHMGSIQEGLCGFCEKKEISCTESWL